tara:strand:- start:71 stop:259 length:189 start_codon:yes stop_codon:yes gene_type:complete
MVKQSNFISVPTNTTMSDVIRTRLDSEVSAIAIAALIPVTFFLIAKYGCLYLELLFGNDIND